MATPHQLCAEGGPVECEAKGPVLHLVGVRVRVRVRVSVRVRVRVRARVNVRDRFRVRVWVKARCSTSAHPAELSSFAHLP